MDGLAIAAALSEIAPLIEGAQIQAVKEPTRGVIVLSLRTRSRSTVRLLMAPRHAALHLTELRFPPSHRASPFVMLLRKQLRGARIAEVRQDGWDRIVRLSCASRDVVGGGEPLQLIAELVGVHGNVILAQGGTILASWRGRTRLQIGASYQPVTSQPKLDPAQITDVQLASALLSSDPARELMRRVDGLGMTTATQLLERVDTPGELAGAIRRLAADATQPEPGFDPERGIASFSSAVGDAPPTDSFSDALDRALGAALERRREEAELRLARRHVERARAANRRARERIQRWIGAADSLTARHHADLLMTHAREIPRGAARVDLEDPADGRTVSIDLDPAITPMEQAQLLYRRARRIERGLPQAQARLQRLHVAAEAIDRMLEDLSAGVIPPSSAIERAAPERAPQRPGAGSSAPRILDGYTIEVGRSAAENDALLRRAKAHDLWLHVEGAAGAHVIIHRKDRQPIPSAVVHEAARLAVLHSKKRHEARAQVHVAEARHVRKPKGAPPGLVRLTEADTLTVSVDAGGGASAS